MTQSYTTVSIPDIFVAPITLEVFHKELENFCDKHNIDRANQHPNTFIPFELILPHKVLFGKRVYQILNAKTITVEIIVNEDENVNLLSMSGISRDWNQFLRYWLNHLIGYLAAKYSATLEHLVSFDPTSVNDISQFTNDISQCGRKLGEKGQMILTDSIYAMRTNKNAYDQGLMFGHIWGFTKTISPIPPTSTQPEPVKPASAISQLLLQGASVVIINARDNATVNVGDSNIIAGSHAIAVDGNVGGDVTIGSEKNGNQSHSKKAA